jgi:hypothetical protein
MLADLSVRFTNVEPLKGRRIAEHYPAGILRRSYDLDLFITEPTGFWEVAQYLQREGWQQHPLTFQLCEDGEVGVATALSHGGYYDRLTSPPVIELSDFALAGNRRLVAWRGRELSIAALIAAAICEEVFQENRTQLARRVLDMAVILDLMPEDQLHSLGIVISRLSLSREFRTLYSLGTSWGLICRDEQPHVPKAQRTRRRSRRPVWPQLLYRALCDINTGPANRFKRLQRATSRVVLQPFASQLVATKLLRMGCWIFGVWVDDRQSAGLSFDTWDGLEVAMTPLGTFALVVRTGDLRRWEFS